MMIVGLGFKLSLVPFHLWTPDVYEGAPAPVSTFLATASKIAIFAVLLRLFQIAPAALNNGLLHDAIAVIAVASILFGNLLALTQSNIKRLLGYSSIAHLGYLLVALIAQQGHGRGSGRRLPGHLRPHHPRRLRRGHPDVHPVPRPRCRCAVRVPWPVLAPAGPVRGDDRDDAVAGRHPADRSASSASST